MRPASIVGYKGVELIKIGTQVLVLGLSSSLKALSSGKRIVKHLNIYISIGVYVGYLYIANSGSIEAV